MTGTTATSTGRVRRGLVTSTILRAYRARDFELELLEDPVLVTESFLRVRVRVPGLLTGHGFTPAMYLRLWFERDGAGHQRAFTVTEPDVERDELTLAVALHPGIASDWFRGARAGDRREATLLGRGHAPSAHPHDRLLAVADMASLAALGDVLAASVGVPADVVLEIQHDADADVPVPLRPGDALHVVRRRDGDAPSAAILEAVDDIGLDGRAVWIAADTRTTRSLVRTCRAAGLPSAAIDALGYWNPAGMA